MGRVLLAALSAALLAGCGSPARVGAIVSRSGAAAGYGERVTRGFDLAVAEINRAGGVRGRRLELLYRDDATNSEVGVAVARELVEKERLTVILGAVSSPVTLSVGAYCQRRHVVLVSPSASAPEITRAGDYVFRTYPSDVLEGAAMAEFARDLGLDRVAVLAVDDEYGRSLAGVFEERLAAAGGVSAGRFTFVEGDEASLGAAVALALAGKPRGLYVPAYVTDVAAALRLLRQTGARPVVLGTSSVTEDVTRLAGPAAENLVFPMPGFAPGRDEPEARAFAAAYDAAYGESPDVYAAHAYDTVKLIAAAAEHAGSWGADDLRKTLLKVDNFEGVTGRIAFDANGDVAQYPRLWIVRGGELLPYDRFVENGGALPLPPR